MQRYPIREIREKAIQYLCEAGLPHESAEELTKQLLYAEQRGLRTHGLVRLRWLASLLDQYPDSKIQLLLDGGMHQLYDGKGVLGQIALQQVVEQQPTAERFPLRMVGIRHCWPTGVLAYFAEQLCEKGWIVLMSSAAHRRIGIFGDSIPLAGTNPWTFALPVRNAYGGFVVVDVSLSEVTFGEILKQKELNQFLPPHAVSLPGGIPTQDPNQLWENGKFIGFMHSVGREKAYKTLNILWSLHVLTTRLLENNGTDEFGTTLLLISPAIWEPVIPREEILRGLEEEIEVVRQAKKFHVPGEGRSMRLKENRDTIPVPEEIAGWLGLGNE
jgi:LDH2 family malate/lactate/ureidoglycolate dehydrogenase